MGFYRGDASWASRRSTGRKRQEVAAIMIHHSQNTCRRLLALHRCTEGFVSPRSSVELSFKYNPVFTLRNLDHHFFNQMLFCVIWRKFSQITSRLLSPTDNSAPERLVRSPAFNSVTLWHHYITMSYICIITVSQLVWHVEVDLAQLLCCCCCC